MPIRRLLLALALLSSWPGRARPAAPAAPPPPAEYAVQIRYDIKAFSNERLRQYFDMMAFIKGTSFKRNPDEPLEDTEPEDPKSNRINGVMASAKVRTLLGQSSIRTLRLIARGVNLPAEKDQPVRVQIELVSGLSVSGQQQLAAQTRRVLQEVGFKEAAGYDSRGASRLVGAIPVGQLDALLNDLRLTPAGSQMGAPFNRVWALRVVEVLPGMPVPAPRPAPALPPLGQAKIAQDLREVLADPMEAERRRRVEILLALPPRNTDTLWQNPFFQAAPGIALEGRLGVLLSAQVATAQILALAALPDVAAIRLPRSGRSLLDRAGLSATPEPFQPLRAHGPVSWPGLSGRNRRMRAVVVDVDFRGWEALRGKELPAGTRLIDLTRESNLELEPDPDPPGAGTSSGVRSALTLLKAIPGAELTLVRIAGDAPYMLQEIADSIAGKPFESLSMAQRLRELDNDRITMAPIKEALLERRRQELDNFSQEEDAVKRRKDYFKQQAEFDRQQVLFQQRVQRYLTLQKDMRSLRDAGVVLTALVWNEGYPVVVGTRLNRYYDERSFRAALWFQAAGEGSRQNWTGLFRDEDGNGVMELLAPAERLPKDTWSRELNFLDWEAEGKTTGTLPAGAQLRVSIQWREPHDPDLLRAGEDGYRIPLAFFRLVVLYQPDPLGTAQPADDLEMVAESAGVPQRLEVVANAATYEQIVQFKAARPGRYTVRVEGLAPTGIRPPNAPTLPALQTYVELRPRLYVETLAGAGRASWHDYATKPEYGNDP